MVVNDGTTDSGGVSGVRIRDWIPVYMRGVCDFPALLYIRS